MKISYTRSYFLFNNQVRITYDKNIKYNLLNKFELKDSTIEDHMNVVEVKFDEPKKELALDLVGDSNFYPKRFSKYLRSLYLHGIATYI